jgi:hypothetical protein
MRSLSVSCAALVAALLASPGQAEDPIVSRVAMWKAKPGLEAKLEAGIKAHNEFHRKLNDTKTFETYVITSGPDSGAYLRVAPGRNWRDFDTEATGNKADQADSDVNTTPYIASSETEYWRVRMDLSRPRPEMTPPAMYSIVFYRLKFGKVADFEMALKKSKEALDKANWPRHNLVLSRLSGGEGPTWAILQARQKFADFNPPEGKTFQQVLEEHLGRDEADARLQMFNGAVESVFSQMIEHRPDLSYAPAKK